jgi:hypothetical protein
MEGIIVHDNIAQNVQGLSRIATDDFMTVFIQQVRAYNNTNPDKPIRFQR